MTNLNPLRKIADPDPNTAFKLTGPLVAATMGPMGPVEVTIPVGERVSIALEEIHVDEKGEIFVLTAFYAYCTDCTDWHPCVCMGQIPRQKGLS